MRKTISMLILLCIAALAQQKGSFTDTRDGKTYKTVKIGKQVWMAENLNYNAGGSKCYDNNECNCNKYGRLYDWSTAMDISIGYNNSFYNPSSSIKYQGVCPSGWHIPNHDEWQTLVNFASSGIAGQKLKAKNGWRKWDCEWTSIDNRGRTKKNSKCNSDNYGFSALPGGYGDSDGHFGNAGYVGYWWSSSESSANGAYSQSMDYGYEGARYINYIKRGLFSVRCLQDNEHYYAAKAAEVIVAQNALEQARQDSIAATCEDKEKAEAQIAAENAMLEQARQDSIAAAEAQAKRVQDSIDAAATTKPKPSRKQSR